MIWDNRTISPKRMLSIKIPHIHCAPQCRLRKSSKVKARRGRVHITKLKDTIPDGDLKEQKSYFRIDRGTKKALCQRAENVSQAFLSIWIYGTTGKGRSLRVGWGGPGNTSWRKNILR